MFAAKRKARVIRTLDDPGDQGSPASEGDQQAEDSDVSAAVPSSSLQAPLKFGKRPHKQSSLRQSININDDEDSTEGGAPTGTSTRAEDGGSEGPVVVKPSLGRSGSTKLKKRKSASRLSFGAGASLADDDDDEVSTPKKGSLSQRAKENSALKNSISHRLPTRFAEENEERPKYSKEYLDELQSSTPNTPQNLSSLRTNDGDMDLDPSELEGAMVVDSSELFQRNTDSATQVLTEAEIREKKERRARLAQEQDFISFDSDNEANGGYISLPPRKKTTESRLIAEDEDLGEGYDEYVEDGGLSLGKKAEREARKRRKQEMAELINAAEGDEDEESDDSEAERRAAYEAAQTRAGMDGLHKADDGYDGTNGSGPAIIPKMKPLPELTDCLARMQGLVQRLEDEVAKKRKKISDLDKEKEEILEREVQLQKILNEAGQKYQAEIGGDATKGAAQSPFRPIPPGLAADFPVERGLESLGTTPTRRVDASDAA